MVLSLEGAASFLYSFSKSLWLTPICGLAPGYLRTIATEQSLKVAW
jgi:hypothetical protein